MKTVTDSATEEGYLQEHEPGKTMGDNPLQNGQLVTPDTLGIYQQVLERYKLSVAYCRPNGQVYSNAPSYQP